VIVIGDSGVGKSNILNRWVKGCFGNDTIIATTQCAFHSKTFKMASKDNSAKDKIVAVQLWDTGKETSKEIKHITNSYSWSRKVFIVNASILSWSMWGSCGV
jgi:GTPase SAR1 family protein